MPKEGDIILSEYRMGNLGTVIIGRKELNVDSVLSKDGMVTATLSAEIKYIDFMPTEDIDCEIVD